MSLLLDIQYGADLPGLPTRAEMERWVCAALTAAPERADTDTELTIRLVDAAEGQALNLRFRGRDKPTNVLSFPFETPPGLGAAADGEPPMDLLIGDLVICAPVVAREAVEQGKPAAAHWAHMVVHGVLHLLGHDHMEPAEAECMESLETAILGGLGFPSPYEVPEGTHDERPI
jgi:probable rRNA maturation factor